MRKLLLLIIIFNFLNFSAHAYVRYIYSENDEIKISYLTNEMGDDSSTQITDGKKGSIFSDTETYEKYLIQKNQLRLSITLQEAQELIDFFADRSPIPFQYIEDYCFSRAHEMALAMEYLGIKSYKIFAEGNFQVTDNEGTEFRWKYHVAPYVMVEIDGKLEPKILDLSFKRGLLSHEEWFSKFSFSECDKKGQFEMYDPRDHHCVYFETPRFFYQTQDLWQLYEDWQIKHLDNTFDNISRFESF